MNKILVIANGESDLLDLLVKHCNVTVKRVDDPVGCEEFDALCVLGGTEANDISMPAPLHNLAEKMHEEGKPIFFEFVYALFCTRSKGKLNTARQRMVYRAAALECGGVSDGDLFDGQSNDCIIYNNIYDGSRPILTYKEHVCAHSNIAISEQEHKEGTYALWWYDSTTLVSSIRVSNFHRARFAPRARWQGLISGIISFLAGEAVVVEFAPPVYTYREGAITSAAGTESVVKRGIEWIYNADMLKNGGRGGAREGFFNRINARTGEHKRNEKIRADCTAEIAGALIFDSLISGNKQSGEVANLLFDFNFENFLIKSGPHKGMLRWSEAGWYDCYADDVARAIIPELLCQYLGAEVPHFAEIREALDYLVSTTAKNGIRAACTQINTMTPEYIEQITGDSIGEPCAHFNAFYHAALLLAYRVCGDEKYLDYATRGLTTLMSVYPETRRETSETEEYARLIFPLAVLYHVTGKREHYDWLVRVTEDLQKFRHACGGYAEWDTGYKAGCSRNHNGECALLADNGDPIADLLYSNNWLPLAFAFAYYVTAEKRFYDLWCGTASFMASTQMHSDSPGLNGAWARAYDMQTGENCGMPHDKGWGPHCIESGWTVGEILMGLQFMHVAEKKHGK